MIVQERERKRCKNRVEKLKDCHLVKILPNWYSALKFTVSWIFWLSNNHKAYWININFIESKKFFHMQEDQTRHSPTGGRSNKRSWNKIPKIPTVLLVWIKLLNKISFKKRVDLNWHGLFWQEVLLRYKRRQT